MDGMDPYIASSDRYESMPYRRTGASGLKLPAISLGLWHNFGDDVPLERQRAILRHAFDLGITHFDLANNYGPPAGSAEINAGRILREDFAPYRDELVISTKAGWDMQPGPYGFGGSRKYLLDSLDASLRRLGQDHVDIYYHHRPDPDTPIEESMAALDQAVRSGKARYAGISSYSAARTREAAAIMRDLGTPLLIHQPSYSLLNRWVEGTEGDAESDSLLQAASEEGLGVIAFSPLAQGLLTDKYLHGIPEGSRAAAGKMKREFVSEENLGHVRALGELAAARGQSLAQMAIAWVLRERGDRTVTSVVLGASSPEQLDQNVGAIVDLSFSETELAEIDVHAVDSGINQWWVATESTI